MSQIGFAAAGGFGDNAVSKETRQDSYTTLNNTDEQDITPLVYSGLLNDIAVELDMSGITGKATIRLKSETDTLTPEQAIEFVYPDDNDSADNKIVTFQWVGKGVDFKATIQMENAQDVDIPISIASYSY